MHALNSDQCTALNQLSTAILVLEPSGSVVFANEAFGHWSGLGSRRAKLIDWRELDVTGRFLASFQSLPDDGVRALRDLDLLLHGELRRADLIFKRPIFDTDWTLLEVHPQNDAAQDEKMALAVLEAIRGLAHEIKNPLAGLQGAAQLLARRVNDDSAQSCVKVIRAEVDRLAALTDRLLRPQAPAAHTRVNVHAVLERVRVLAESEAEWVAKIERDYDPSLPAVQGDTDRLVQAVWNLVRNAIEAGPSEIRLRTRIEHAAPLDLHQTQSAVRIDVIDNGHGIAAELRERIFLPLVTGRADGTGLGLPLTQTIAREHGGLVSFQSRPGQTTFTLLLPIAASEEGGDHA